jgi:uncharacterized cupredoxin-like copper-binding protein
MFMRNSRLFALSLLAFASSPALAQAPTTVQVQLANFSFTPKTIVLDHGHSYVLRLVNAASGGHDFTAPQFFAAASVAAADRSKVTEGEVEVPAGKEIDIHLTAPGSAGRYKLKCSHTFHKMFGMSGEIVVR